MIPEPSLLAVAVFSVFVAITLGLSFYLGSKTRSAKGYFAAGGGIPWFVNGVAFAGDYLSAASFLGICGMIAFYGYDGFLYSIGYLAGWIVALFVIAEPLKRMGKYTFADALDSRFNSRGIKLAAATSTLVVSIFYLIPQMVGAGVLIRPLLGFPHWQGVVIVGAVVIIIVVTAGMVSTTWVQFIKGSLLVIFSTVLTVMILNRGLQTSTPPTLLDEQFRPLNSTAVDDAADWHLLPDEDPWRRPKYIRARYRDTDRIVVARETAANSGQYVPTQTVTLRQGVKVINGLPQGSKFEDRIVDLEPVGHVAELPPTPTRSVSEDAGDSTTASLARRVNVTGPLGPLEFLATLQQSTIVLTGIESVKEADGSTTTIYYPKPTPGSEVLRPGNHPSLKGMRSDKLSDKLNFLSLMLALFGGTASLPHILIRYYTVKDQAAARKSTIVGIASIGFFYVLTLYMGLGAMTSGALDPTNDNMAAPLLAKSLSPWLFAVISAIAFTTVLGTVSGLIIAASGAVAHDLMDSFFRLEMTDHIKVRIAKITAVVVGIIAIVLGILFEKMNVSYLVGWAFSVAASANLPSLVMLLFWKGTTRQGITAAVTVGMFSSLGWILASGDTYDKIYGLPAADALVPFSQPGIVTIPLGFVVLVLVSLCTRKARRYSVSIARWTHPKVYSGPSVDSAPLDPLRQEIAAAARTVVVKVGTRVLTGEDGRLDEARVAELAEDLHRVMQSGRKVAMVSSGAVGSGMGRLGLTRRPATLSHLQAVAAVGQSHLVEVYERSLRAHGRHASQILLTAEDLDDRTRYLNVRNTILACLEFGAVPIINENDTVSVEELQTTFGDNDKLAAMVTNLIRAPLLVLLSDVEGLFDGDPRDPASKLVSTVTRLDDSIWGLVRDKLTGLSKGGMASKLNAARIATSAGENVIIASGRTPGVLSRIVAGEPLGTLFVAQGQSVASWKRWIGYTAQPRGHIVVDDGARRAIEKQGRSLLAIGVVEAVGNFTKGDIVAVRDPQGQEFARGLINYPAADVLRIKGLKTEQIAQTLGLCPYDEVIHRDNMAVTS